VRNGNVRILAQKTSDAQQVSPKKTYEYPDLSESIWYVVRANLGHNYQITIEPNTGHQHKTNDGISHSILLYISAKQRDERDDKAHRKYDPSKPLPWILTGTENQPLSLLWQVAVPLRKELRPKHITPKHTEA
jgi:hypothetical protein